jgi:DNA replication protein DnaC
MNNTLKQHARTLRLSGLLESMELRLQEAEANRLPHAQFLELLFQDEINVRHQRLINRRHKLADFREVRSLDNFDFSFNPNTNRAQIYELATGHFVAQRRDVLLVGPPGVGKSHLVQAIGREVLKAGFLVLYRSIFDLVRELLTQETQVAESRLLNKYLKPDLLIIDDMGLKILPQKSGEILLEIIMRRYENRSTMMTSNRPIEEWGNCSAMFLPPARSSTACCIMPKSSPSTVAVTDSSPKLNAALPQSAPQPPVQAQIRHKRCLPTGCLPFIPFWL